MTTKRTRGRPRAPIDPALLGTRKDVELARMYRVTTATIRNHRKRLGIAACPPRKDRVKREAVSHLLDIGYSYADVGQLFGMHRWSVSRLAKRCA